MTVLWLGLAMSLIAATLNGLPYEAVIFGTACAFLLLRVSFAKPIHRSLLIATLVVAVVGLLLTYGLAWKRVDLTNETGAAIRSISICFAVGPNDEFCVGTGNLRDGRTVSLRLFDLFNSGHVRVWGMTAEGSDFEQAGTWSQTPGLFGGRTEIVLRNDADGVSVLFR